MLSALLMQAGQATRVLSDWLPAEITVATPTTRSRAMSSATPPVSQEHCQINFKAPALDEEGAQLCSTELTPLGKSGGTVQLEIFAAVEMTLLIEMIVYG